MTDPDPYLRTAQVAAILNVHPRTVSRWSREGKLPCLRTIGKHRRYPEAEIRALAHTLQTQAATERANATSR